MRKVLIIEDDAALLGSVVQMLELADLEPIATGSFVQARRYIRANFKGVILSDIKMPNHTGFDVLRFALSKDTELPVILLTGHSDVPTAMKAIKEGAYDYLEKPYDPDRLIETLNRALNMRELSLQNRQIKQQLEAHRSEELDGNLAEQLNKHERRVIENALLAENGKVSKAAERLGIPRNTLYDRMNRLRLSASSFKNPKEN